VVKFSIEIEPQRTAGRRKHKEHKERLIKKAKATEVAFIHPSFIVYY
jgi:hypothetical protein